MATDSAGASERQARTVRFEVVDVASPDARTAIDAYLSELDERFPSGFDASAGGRERDEASMAPPGGAFVVAIDAATDGAVAAGGIQRVDARTGEIKRMWVHREWRGAGLGRRLLAELEAQAAALGYGRVVLDTNRVLVEAIALYERSGYEPIPRYNDNPYAEHWFAKSLDGEISRTPP